MDKILIIKIIFGSLLSVGAFLLLLLAYLLFYKYIIQEKRCTEKTKGVVKKYTLGTRGGEHSGIHLPVVSYNVGGKEYKVVGPEYKSYVVITKSGPMNENSEVYKEENQVLTINRSANSFVEMRGHIMEHIYPVGTKIDVFYNPKKPKLAYVKRYCNKKWGFWLMFLSGIAIIIINLLILFML